MKMRFIQWPIKDSRTGLYGYSCANAIEDTLLHWDWISNNIHNFDMEIRCTDGKKRYLRKGDWFIINKDGDLFQGGKYLNDE